MRIIYKKMVSVTVELKEDSIQAVISKDIESGIWSATGETAAVPVLESSPEAPQGEPDASAMGSSAPGSEVVPGGRRQRKSRRMGGSKKQKKRKGGSKKKKGGW
jgi:hypothetical protein